MNNEATIIITIGTITSISSFILMFVVLFPKSGIFRRISKFIFHRLSSFDTSSLEEKVRPAIEKKIGQFFSESSAQIPMGAAILAGTLGQSLKSKGVNAVLETVPKIKMEVLSQGERWILQLHHQHWPKILFTFGLLFSLASGIVAMILGAVLVYMG